MPLHRVFRIEGRVFTDEREKSMKPNFMRLAVATSTAALACSVALAQDVEKVNIEAKRAMTTKIVGRTSSGLPVADITLDYAVSTKGLNLASSAGAAELTKRISNAAREACREIGRRYPNAAPTDSQCTKAAADTAMVKVHELAAQAHGDARAR
jgi:UrcA family protein